MPIAVKRNSIKVEDFVKSSTNKTDVHGTEYLLPVYNVFVFKKEIPSILFYAANGMTWALTYLGVNNIMEFVEEYVYDEKSLYFQISSKCYLKVNKELFLKYPYVQSIVGGLLHVSTNRLTIDDLNNKNIWIKKLSNNNTIEKGRDILIFFNRLLDQVVA